MPIVPPSFIQEVRNRTSIVGVVGQTVKLKRRGSEYWGCCPFHHEKPLLFPSATKGIIIIVSGAARMETYLISFRKFWE